MPGFLSIVARLHANEDKKRKAVLMLTQWSTDAEYDRMMSDLVSFNPDQQLP